MAQSTDRDAPHNRKLGRLITAISLLAIAFLTLGPSQQAAPAPMFCLVCGPLGGVDLVLNVLLFVPLGIGLRWQTGRLRAAVVIGLLFTLTIELLQWRTIPGRDASLADVVANVAGAALGAWIGSQLRLWWLLAERPAIRAGTLYSLLASAAVLFLALLLQPRRSFDSYFVQWTRALHAPNDFAGRLNWAVLNSMRLEPAGVVRRIESSDSERSRLSVSLGVSGPIVPSRRRVEILRIGNSRSEAMMLGQRDSTLVFRAFTRAERLRLRSPLIALPLTAPVGGSADEGASREVIISAHSTPDAIELSMAGHGVDVGVSVPRTIGLTWSLFAPWEVAFGPHWWLANAAWLALIVLPASFLASRSQVKWGLAGSAIILTVLASFAVIPLATGLSQATPGEWGGVFAGVVAGHGLARLPLPRAAHT